MVSLGLVGGLYLSGYLTLLLLHLDTGLLRWHSYPDYIHAIDVEQVRPYVLRIRFAGIVGFGAPLFASLALLMPVLRSPRNSIHGDARFASRGDLARQPRLDLPVHGALSPMRGHHVLTAPGKMHD